MSTKTVMTPGTVDLVLVGTTEALSGRERLLAAIHDDDQLLVLIEAQRPSNGPLLDATELCIHDSAGVQIRPVVSRRVLTDDERQQFEAATPARLGTNLEVIRLGAPAITLNPEDPSSEVQDAEANTEATGQP